MASKLTGKIIDQISLISRKVLFLLKNIGATLFKFYLEVLIFSEGYFAIKSIFFQIN